MQLNKRSSCSQCFFEFVVYELWVLIISTNNIDADFWSELLFAEISVEMLLEIREVGEISIVLVKHDRIVFDVADLSVDEFIFVCGDLFDWFGHELDVHIDEVFESWMSLLELLIVRLSKNGGEDLLIWFLSHMPHLYHDFLDRIFIVDSRCAVQLAVERFAY